MSAELRDDRLVTSKGREIFYDEIASLEAAGRRCKLTLHDGKSVTLKLDDAEVAKAFGEQLQEILTPQMILRADALPQEIGGVLGRVTGAVGCRATPIVEWLLAQAALSKASDVHLTPEADAFAIALRIDGQLHEIARLPEKLGRRLGARIKVLAGLHVHRVDTLQEGRLPRPDADLRVSVVPTTGGEAYTLRLLGSRRSAFALPELGFADGIASALGELTGQSSGIFLVTGPSGSGKTTTLYALLRALLETRGDFVSCATIEDPVESTLPSVRQIEVDRRRGVDYASALASLLRHDIDVILLGEIRDPETAMAAFRAALTGHLVMATLHLSRAAEVLPRLLDLGVDASLIASTLRGVLAQRLRRRLCEACNGEGCRPCLGTGHRGRFATGELLLPTDALAALLARERRPSTDEVLAAAAWPEGQLG